MTAWSPWDSRVAARVVLGLLLGLNPHNHAGFLGLLGLDLHAS